LLECACDCQALTMPDAISDECWGRSDLECGCSVSAV
jgi:hypothetical protein